MDAGKTLALLASSLLGALALAADLGAQDPDADPPSQAARISVASGTSFRVSPVAKEGWMSAAFDDASWPKADVEFDGNPDEAFKQLSPSNCFAFDTSASWIWRDGESRVFLRRRFTVECDVSNAWLVLIADNEASVFLNGAPVGRFSSDTDLWGGRGVARAFDVLPYLKEGANVIAVEASDKGGCKGVCFELRIDGGPFADLLKEVKAAIPPPGIIERWKPAFALREYSFEQAWELYSRAGVSRNGVAHLKALSVLAQEDRPRLAALLGAILLNGGDREKTDAAGAADLLDLSELKSLVIDAMTSAAGEEARLRLCLSAAKTAAAADLPFLEKTLGVLAPPSGAVLEGLAEALGSADPYERQAAMEKLKALGQEAVPALKRALDSADPAVRIRAAALRSLVEQDPCAALRRIARARLSETAQRLKKGK